MYPNVKNRFNHALIMPTAPKGQQWAVVTILAGQKAHDLSGP